MAAKITKSIKDKDLADMFNQMLGAGATNMNICYPKYESIADCYSKILNVLKMFVNSPFMKSLDELTVQREEIVSFIENAEAEGKVLFKYDFSTVTQNLNFLSDEIKADFADLYEKMKNSQYMHDMIKVCDSLIAYRKHIGNPDELNHKFVFTIPGSEYCPFPFTTLDIKYLIQKMVGEKKDKEVQFIMVVLSKLYELTYKLFQMFSKPDIDIDEFVNVVINNLGEIKKHIPRCDKAFKLIEDSVHMFKNNFTEYYKDFVQTQDQTIIMENFLTDVAKGVHADADLTRQFRQIIKFYRKAAAGQSASKNPKIKMLFDKANENIQFMERYININTANRNEEENQCSDDDSGEEIIAEPQVANQEEYDKKTVEQIMEENGL